MLENVMILIFGALLCVLGAINTTGNVSSLHSYHRHRVSEADKKPFGKLVGIGTIIIGASLIAFGAFKMAYDKTQLPIYLTIGSAVIIVGIIVGLGLNFWAMIKYNKGIF